MPKKRKDTLIEEPALPDPLGSITGPNLAEGWRLDVYADGKLLLRSPLFAYSVRHNAFTRAFVADARIPHSATTTLHVTVEAPTIPECVEALEALARDFKGLP